MKMDLDPEIEAANRETENEKLDLLDEKQVKPIVDMVNAGIMAVETAQEMLGLDPLKNPATSREEAAWAGLSAAAGHPEALCDECVHFDTQTNICRVHRAERTFDTPACRFFEKRLAAQAAPEPKPSRKPCGCGC